MRASLQELPLRGALLSMRVYIASAFSTINAVRKQREELRAIGIECTSSWADEKAAPDCQLPDFLPSDHLFCAITDIKDIDRSDAVVLVTQDPTKPFVRGGRMHEFGYAMGRGKKLIICGPKENIFHYLPSVTECKDFEETKQALLKYQLEMEKNHGATASNPLGYYVSNSNRACY